MVVVIEAQNQSTKTDGTFTHVTDAINEAGVRRIKDGNSYQVITSIQGGKEVYSIECIPPTNSSTCLSL